MAKQVQSAPKKDRSTAVRQTKLRKLKKVLRSSGYQAACRYAVQFSLPVPSIPRGRHVPYGGIS